MKQLSSNSTEHKVQSKQQTGLIAKLFLMFVFLSGIQSFGQTSGYTFHWTGAVGCQSLFPEDPGGPKRGYSIEDIPDTFCAKVCENTTTDVMIYNFTSTNTFSTSWTILGGTILNSGDGYASIRWGSTGQGSLTFTITDNSGTIINKTVCFETVKGPRARFDILPSDGDYKKTLNVCLNQELFCTNLSFANGGTNISHNIWDFGDGTYSFEQNPSHTYSNSGTYTLTLIVINECGCSNLFARKVIVGQQAIVISCPTVVCENKTETYKLDNFSDPSCNIPSAWTIIGGVINSAGGDSVNVTWQNIDENGFGYLSFNPKNCSAACYAPTSIKIPVIQTYGRIKGNTNACVGVQERYTLPQWPSTTFKWEIPDNQNNNLAEIFVTDQANEIVIKSNVATQIKLICTYYNTLLKCGGTASFTIQGTTAPNIIGPDGFCVNTVATYTTPASTNQNWVLKNSIGITVATLNGSPTFGYNFVGVGNYVLSCSDFSQCNATSTKIIKVIAPPALPIVTNITNRLIKTCPGVSYNFTVGGSNPNARYRWSVSSGGSFDGENVGNTVAITFSSASTHTISIVNESLTTPICSSAPISFTLNTFQINAQLNDSSPQTLCGNANSNYSAINTIGTGLYTEGEIYTWSITPSNLGSIATGQGTNAASVIWNNVNTTTTATLSLVIKKCNVTKTLTRTVNLLPKAQIAITSISSICSGSSITFTLNTINGVPFPVNDIVDWTFSDGTTFSATGNSVTKTFSNLTNANIGINATAIINNPNGCTGNTNLAQTSITIFPAPVAAAASTHVLNTFCLESSINRTLNSTTSPSGSTIQWYKTGSPIVLGTSTSLNVTGAPNFGFGGYYFVITSGNGCSTISNEINIIQQCPVVVTPINGSGTVCNITPVPVVTNTSTIGCFTPTTISNCNCGQINLVGSTPGAISQNWKIITPDGSILNIPGAGGSIGTATAPLAPGSYTITNTGTYQCPTAAVATYSETKQLTIPYLANFVYNIRCNANNTNYDIAFTDTSPFFSTVPIVSRTFDYYTGTSITGPWTLVASTQNPVLTNQPSGNYFIRQVVAGTLNGIAQTPCEKIIAFNIISAPIYNITVGSFDCHDKAVQFDIDGFQGGETYLWSFDAGANNTLRDPKRVFDNSGSQTVSVVITSPYGCTKTLTRTITIPAKCFNGDISPLDPSVCAGTATRLRYIPSGTECAVTQYQWLREGVVVATNANPFYDAITPGTYRVRVRSGLNCIYTTPSVATPRFISPPALFIKGSTQECQSTPLNLEAVTVALEINWYINGNLDSSYNNQKIVAIANLPVGNNVITVVAVNLSGCSTTANTTILIVAVPTPPVLTYSIIGCSPYKVQITAAGTPPFSWSNGAIGPTIEVGYGGTFKATSGGGTCNSSTSIIVPKHQEYYMWTFPYGCISSCVRDNVSIVGPHYPMQEWAWNESGNTIGSGTGLVTPLSLSQSGSYTMSLGVNPCKTTSKPLSFNQQGCEKCDIAPQIMSMVANNVGYCQITLTINVINYLSTPTEITFSETDNKFFVNPTSIVLQPGANTITINLIPINGFSGGAAILQMGGIDGRDNKCITRVPLNVPSCAQFNRSTLQVTTFEKIAKFGLQPNPTSGLVKIVFENTDTTAVTIYDLLGKKIATQTFNASTESWDFDTTTVAKGVYIVVFNSDSQILSQQKLIVN